MARTTGETEMTGRLDAHAQQSPGTGNEACASSGDGRVGGLARSGWRALRGGFFDSLCRLAAVFGAAVNSQEPGSIRGEARRRDFSRPYGRAPSRVKTTLLPRRRFRLPVACPDAGLRASANALVS